MACSQPHGDHGIRTFDVGACGQFGDVVRCRVRFDPSQFPKIIHWMTTIGRAGTHAEEEQPSAALTEGDKAGRYPLDRRTVKLPGNLHRLLHVIFGMSHADFLENDGGTIAMCRLPFKPFDLTPIPGSYERNSRHQRMVRMTAMMWWARIFLPS